MYQKMDKAIGDEKQIYPLRIVIDSIEKVGCSVY